MSNFATLFALGREYNLTIFVTADQLKIMKPFFNSEAFVSNVKVLEEHHPDWQSLKWTNPFP
jgi:hypothetical protein